MTRSIARTVGTTHTVFVAAPARAVYSLIADVSHWAFLFSPVVHAERLSGGMTEERVRLWTVGNGAVRRWTSRRSLDRDALRIRFRHEDPQPPVASLSGEWVFVPLPGNATSVVLLHEFQATGDDPGNTALIKQVVDRNSTAELAAVKRTAEQGDRLAALTHTFSESVVIRGGLGPVYDFLYQAENWPRLLPHVSQVTLDETVPNVQTIEMDMTGPGGSAHTLRLVRVCSPYHSIVYKQTEPPDAVAAHAGAWLLYPMAEGVRVTTASTLLLRPDKAAGPPGRPVGADRRGELIRQALRENCRAMLLYTRDAAERRAGPGDAA